MSRAHATSDSPRGHCCCYGSVFKRLRVSSVQEATIEVTREGQRPLRPRSAYRLPYFLGAIRAKIILRALILRRWRAKFSLSKTQVTLPSTPVVFT